MNIELRSCLFVVALAGFAGTAAAHEDLGFELNITLSPKAAERLRSMHEGITADASYYGDPTAAAARHADEVGHIPLGVERIELPGRAGPVRVTGQKLAIDRLDWISGGVNVNVNLYSARHRSRDNILACDFIDGSVEAVVKAQPVTLHCGLITENANTALRP